MFLVCVAYCLLQITNFGGIEGEDEGVVSSEIVICGSKECLSNN